MKNAEWEFASSPIIHDGKVIIQCDVLENSFLAAYDIKTGKEIWKAERDEYRAGALQISIIIMVNHLLP